MKAGSRLGLLARDRHDRLQGVYTVGNCCYERAQRWLFWPSIAQAALHILREEQDLREL